MRLIWSTVALLSLFASTGRAADGPCVDTPNGLPIARGDEVICRVEQTIDASSNPELGKQTKGLVTAVDLQADLRFPAKPASAIGGTVDTLSLSPQTAGGFASGIGFELLQTIGIPFALLMAVAVAAHLVQHRQGRSRWTVMRPQQEYPETHEEKAA